MIFYREGIQDKQECDRCGSRVEIDAGGFRCIATNAKTGKCTHYTFICDECSEKERKEMKR